MYISILYNIHISVGCSVMVAPLYHKAVTVSLPVCVVVFYVSVAKAIANNVI